MTSLNNINIFLQKNSIRILMIYLELVSLSYDRQYDRGTDQQLWSDEALEMNEMNEQLNSVKSSS